MEDGSHYATFYFNDPEGKAEALEVELATGGLAPALSLLQAVRILKSQSFKLQKTSRNSGVYGRAR